MPKVLFYLTFLFFCSLSFAQNTFAIKGKVTEDGTKLPVESATVYITSVKDSTVLDYSITNNLGNFDFKIRKISQPVFLKISFVGYETYKQTLESINKDIDFAAKEKKPSNRFIGKK